MAVYLQGEYVCVFVWEWDRNMVNIVILMQINFMFQKCHQICDFLMQIYLYSVLVIIIVVAVFGQAQRKHQAFHPPPCPSQPSGVTSAINSILQRPPFSFRIAHIKVFAIWLFLPPKMKDFYYYRVCNCVS